MRILAVYGFHKEEAEFGSFVCGEYNRRYSPDNSLLVTKPITNSAHQRDKTQEQVGYREICDLIQQYQPDVFIDIHHSKGITSDMSEQLNSLQSPPKPKKKGRLASFLDRLMGLKDIEQRSYSTGPLDDLLKDLSKPLIVSYWNPEVNPVLFDWLSQQTDLGSMPKPSDIRMSDRRFQIASENGTVYITVEAMLNGEDGQIEKDDHYYDTAERLTELMHRIQDHVNSE